MHLTCPNCGAVYEVDGSAIPPEGRDVQCSNCGHCWYQTHPRRGEAEAPGPAAAPQANALREGADRAEPPEDEAPETDPGGGPAPPRHRLDETVRAILREEAEHESRTRRARPDTPGGQARPGLAFRGRARPAPEAAGPAPAPYAHPDGASGGRPPVSPAEDVDAAPPDSATPPGDEAGVDIRSDPGRRRGRSPFALALGATLLVGAAVAAVYLYRDGLAALLPRAEPALARFATIVDSLRLEAREALTALVRQATELLSRSGD